MPWKELGISEIIEAEDGVQALNIAKVEKPDIILSDIRMPRLSGIELVEALRKQLECTIIFMSAYTDKEYLKSAIRFHAIAYVEKPIVIRELQTVIEEAVTSIKNKEKKNQPAALHIPEEPLNPSEEKQYLELFSHALLRVSGDAVEQAIDEIAIELKKTKQRTIGSVRPLIQKMNSMLNEYALSFEIPMHENANTNAQLINSAETWEQFRYSLLSQAGTIFDSIQPLSETARLAARVMFIIRLNYQDSGLYIPFICDKLHSSRSKTCGDFKKETGKTINEAILQFRLDRACKLLKNPRAVIADIAAETGFTDQNYFTRSFKQVFGITPSSYRAGLEK
jgi:YesN/AraC family two-component response regulator